MLKDDLQNCSFEFGLQLFGANKIRIDEADRCGPAENLERQWAAKRVTYWRSQRLQNVAATRLKWFEALPRCGANRARTESERNDCD
jgi:hypothetical protein